MDTKELYEEYKILKENSSKAHEDYLWAEHLVIKKGQEIYKATKDDLKYIKTDVFESNGVMLRVYNFDVIDGIMYYICIKEDDYKNPQINCEKILVPAIFK